MSPLFTFENYKPYVLAWIQAKPRQGYGLQMRIAQALGCKTPYVSAVLRGSAHFSSEQADAFNRFADHGELEAHFFHLLVLRERAGSKALRAYLTRQLERARSKSLDVKSYMPTPMNLPDATATTYFSTWHFAAVHTLLTIAEFQTVDALVKKTRLTALRVVDVLGFLVSAGLAHQNGDHFEPLNIQMHLGSQSPQITQHHANCRLQALRNIQNARSEQDLHYSSVASMSAEDFLQVKRRLVAEIAQIKEIVNPSPAERLYCFNIDLYEDLK